MAGKGIGATPIIAVALLSTVVTIILDYYGLTTIVQRSVQKMVK